MIHFSRTSHRYRCSAPEQAALRMRIKEFAEVRVSYGYRRIHVLLLREGWKVNHKRVYRLYKQEGLTMRSKKPWRRHVSGKNRIERPVATTGMRPGRWTSCLTSCSTATGSGSLR